MIREGELTMKTGTASAMAKRMSDELLNYGPDRSRLLIRVLRLVAQGHPVDGWHVTRIVDGLGIAQDDASQFLRQITERDVDDRIVGIMGLSLNDHPHRFVVNGVSLTTWCAEDTFFLPALLEQTAIVESASPLSNAKINLTISPQRVEKVSPVDAVVSIVVLNPTEENLASVDAIWNTFCRQIHFFSSRDEGERWAAGRDDIEVIDVQLAFELGQQLWSRVLAYAT
jgi:alkylmercury lyase